jgi:hypothetical protein
MAEEPAIMGRIAEGAAARYAGQIPGVVGRPIDVIETLSAATWNCIKTGDVKMSHFLLGIQREKGPSNPFSSYLMPWQRVLRFPGEPRGKFGARKMPHFHLARFGTLPRSR